MKYISILLEHPKTAKLLKGINNLNDRLKPYLPLINSSLVIACTATVLTISLSKGGDIDRLTGEIYYLNAENEELRREISSIEDRAEEALSKADEAQAAADEAKSEVDDLERKLQYGYFND